MEQKQSTTTMAEMQKKTQPITVAEMEEAQFFDENFDQNNFYDDCFTYES